MPEFLKVNKMEENNNQIHELLSELMEDKEKKELIEDLRSEKSNEEIVSTFLEKNHD